ncbi:diaminopimelate decarboxylase [uncultured Thiohalocapsa sp.]|uniref:diaminopimelate decarboxylase n=1 Tax=uncultured Thiohalocapsa sp. TaxID=768990 RepID=UPI0025F30167|nr:diaminopimelate decarboxylase [uncultured Thiohalocapsa sp.]
MDHFNERDGRLFAEDMPVSELAARFGTPCYVYSRATLERHWHAFDRALGARAHLICFAVKANGNLGVLNLLARLGSGFDIVSVGELERVLAAGGDPGKVIFSGVGKRTDEIRRALAVGIRCFNVESEPELLRIAAVAAELDTTATVSLRVNPDVDARSHPYISTGLRENKFGIDIHAAEAVYQRAAALEHIHVAGIDCHIGSQLTELSPFLDALDRVLALLDRLAARGIGIEHLDLGGGLGIRYTDEAPPEPDAYAEALDARLGDRDLEIILEPGRAIAGNAGILLTRVEYLKPTATHNFAIVDAAMNDLLRPALYQAEQEIVPAERRAGEPIGWDIVGPVCETGDFLGKGRALVLAPGDLLAVRSSGAYGFSMSSNYNSRPRAAEVIVDGAEAHLVRRREQLADLYAGESTLP